MIVKAHIRLIATAATVALLAFALSGTAWLTMAQSPTEPLDLEPGRFDAPGDIGYGEERHAVEGEQVDCTIDPGNRRCPPPPPVNLTRPSVSFSTTTATLNTTFRRTVWPITTSHSYKFELHRSSTSSTGFTSVSTSWVEGNRYVTFTGVARGYYYKIRGKRCRVHMVETDCGVWSRWSGTVYVPRKASNLSISRSGTQLTATYTRDGTTWDTMEIANRVIDASGNGTSVTQNPTNNQHSWDGTQGLEYRFRVQRCTTSARGGCDAWSDWTDWTEVPLPPKAYNLRLARNGDVLTATYSAIGTGYDEIDMNRRRIGTTGDGSTEADADVSNKTFTRTVTRGYEYRFRIRRCGDADREICGDDDDWSTWSDWRLIPKEPGKPEISVNDDDLTVNYTDTGTDHEEMEFFQANSRTGLYSSYNGGTLSDKTLSNVEREKWYKVRVRGCVDEESDCTGWFESDPKEVKAESLPADAHSLTLERNKAKLTATYKSAGASYDKIDMNRRVIGGSGDGITEVDTIVSNKKYERTVPRGYEYRFRIFRCTDIQRTNCGDNDNWSDWVPVPKLPDAPTELRLTRSGDTLTAKYKAKGPSHDELNIYGRGLTRSSSTNSLTATFNRSATSASETKERTYSRSVSRGYGYGFQVRRCTDTNRKDCSSWTIWSGTRVDIPSLPAGIVGRPTLTRSQDDLTITYSATGSSNDRYDIENSNTRSGTYSDFRTGTTNLNNVDRGMYYQVSVYRCANSGTQDCRSASSTSNVLYVPNLPSAPGTPSLSVSGDDLTVTYTASGSSFDEIEFQQSDSENGTYSKYTGGTLSGKTRSDVAVNKWYRVRVRRCTDSGFTDCTDWSTESNKVEVKPVPTWPGLVSPTISSGANGTTVIAALRELKSGYSYKLTLLSSTNQKDYFTTGKEESFNYSTASVTFTFTGLVAGQWYQAELRACKAGNTVDCSNSEFTSNVAYTSKAPAPRITGITVSNKNDLTINYTIGNWSDGTANVYDFRISRAETAGGKFDSDYTGGSTPTASPHKFNNVHTGYHYKARARRCSDAAKTDCGDWSGLSSPRRVAVLTDIQSPTSLQMLIVSHKEVRASFNWSTSPTRQSHYYVFELGQSDTPAGAYAYSQFTGLTSSDLSSEGSVSFTIETVGKWYKARGKRCETASRKRCSEWSFSLNWVKPVKPSPKMELITKHIGALGGGLSVPITVQATGLDGTKLYSIRFETSTGMSAKAGVLKFGKCNDDPEDSDVRSLPVASLSSGSVTTHIYGCYVDSDRVTVNLVVDGEAIATVQVPVAVHSVLPPTKLRADGDNRGNENTVEFDIAWQSVNGATGHQLRYRKDCTNAGNPCSWGDWSMPLVILGSDRSWYTVAVSDPDLDFDTLYGIEMRTERNGMHSRWSKPVYVYPGDEPTNDHIAGMKFFGHQPDRNYTYRLCGSSIPVTHFSRTVDRDEWIKEIELGFNAWGTSINWITTIHGDEREFVSVRRDRLSVGDHGPGSCHDWVVGYTYFKIGAPGPPHKSRNIKTRVRVEGISNHEYAEVRFVKTSVIKARCSLYGIPGIGIACAPQADNLASFTTVWEVLALATNRPIPSDVDILFDLAREWVPGPSKMSDECSYLRSTSVHEVGHAFGVSGSHTGDRGSIMYRKVPTNLCGPNSFDLAGMLANYQSLRP